MQSDSDYFILSVRTMWVILLQVLLINLEKLSVQKGLWPVATWNEFTRSTQSYANDSRELPQSSNVKVGCQDDAGIKIITTQPQSRQSITTNADATQSMQLLPSKVIDGTEGYQNSTGNGDHTPLIKIQDYRLLLNALTQTEYWVLW